MEKRKTKKTKLVKKTNKEKYLRGKQVKEKVLEKTGSNYDNRKRWRKGKTKKRKLVKKNK